MFDKISDAAEKLASKVSRRHFFGALGRWAGAAALGVAGLLGSAKQAEGGDRRYYCCFYYNYIYTCVKCTTVACPPPPGGFQLLSSYIASNCNQCFRHGYPACPWI